MLGFDASLWRVKIKKKWLKIYRPFKRLKKHCNAKKMARNNSFLQIYYKCSEPDYFWSINLEMKHFAAVQFVLVLDGPNRLFCVCYNFSFFELKSFELLIGPKQWFLRPTFSGIIFRLIEFYEHNYWSGNFLWAYIKDYQAKQVPSCSFSRFLRPLRHNLLVFSAKTVLFLSWVSLPFKNMLT